ncbi:MAG: DUF1385 domain-containing protein [Clostridia bacterium]|nr:DUF1385 domain-containing protein [Clostridia bacterium]
MNKKKSCNLGKGIGGQAVIEGVMMRGKKMYSLSVRTPDKGIKTVKTFFKPAKDKCFIWGLPIVRGVVAFVDSLVTGMKVTMKSAELAGLDDIEYDKESKFEMWLEKKFGDKLADYLIYFSVFVSIILCIGLFIFLPTVLGGWINGFFGNDPGVRGAIESVIKVLIFLGYMILVSQMKDIKRVFMYHGAEHKTINCFESDMELTVDNVRKSTRFHKRCGTSFLVIVMIISIIVAFIFVKTNIFWLRVALRIILLPVIAGLSYEVIRWAGRHDNLLVNIVSFPGIAMQLITTSEPDDSMIEVAIASLKAVLEEEPEDDSSTGCK